MISLRKCTLRLAVAAVLAAGGPVFAGSGTVGGSVGAINTLTNAFIDNIDILPSEGHTDERVVFGTIDNNSENGWKLTITSTNTGKLKRGTGGAGREILYTNITFVQNGGTLGAGLTNPSGTTKNIVTGFEGGGVGGTTIFNTGTALNTHGTATTATVGYVYELQLTWPADTSLLSGTYTDILTLTLANDI